MICLRINNDNVKQIKDITEYLDEEFLQHKKELLESSDTETVNVNGEARGIADDKESSNVLQLVGAGGKTSLLYYIANRQGSKGQKCAALTSTQMFKPDECFAPESGFYGEEQIDSSDVDMENFLNMTEMLKNAAGWNYFITGRINPANGKLCAPSDRLYEMLFKRSDLLVIEADGSKRKPLKFPKPGEPVIMDDSGICLVVMGLTGLGHKVKDVVFRHKLAMDALSVGEDDTVTEKTIADLINTGYIKPLKEKYPKLKVIPVINQIDDSRMLPSVKKIAQYLDMEILGTVMEPDERKDPI